jgi:hypothetical protein
MMLRSIVVCISFLTHFSVQAQYVLSHINVIDVETGKILPDQSVAIKDHIIGYIHPTSVANTVGQVYDCSGKYMIPGLWDMHIHDAGDDSSNRHEYDPLFLANGVTGIRDMWGSPEMLTLRNDIAADKCIGPRMVIGSPIIDGIKPFFSSSLAANTEQRGRHYVDSLADAGYDFIKIYSLLREPVYLAIADECKKKGIPLEGHLPIEVGLEEALDAGQRSFEHNFNINRYLTGRETPLLQWAHNYLDTVHSTRDGQFMARTEPLGITEKDFQIAPAVLEKMIAHRAAVVPTLTLDQGRGLPTDIMAKQTKGLEYLTRDFVSYWMRQRPILPVEFIQSFGAAAVFLMNKGVLILAGTDVNNPFCVPGFGLQQELVNLSNAGLSNLQVLQTATLNPAKFLYKEKELGTVSVGKWADLLILDENPLVDIHNTQKIYAVIVNGHYLSADDLQQMLTAQRKR